MLKVQSYPHNPTNTCLPLQACVVVDGKQQRQRQRVCAATPMLLDIVRCQRSQTREGKIAVLQYYVDPKKCLITNSKGIVGYVRIFEDPENTECVPPDATLHTFTHTNTGELVLDADSSHVLANIPTQTLPVTKWGSLLGSANASCVQRSITKKNSQLKRLTNDRSQELNDKASRVLEEACDKKRDGGKNITTIDDFVAGRIGLAASRLHLRYCDVVEEKTQPVIKSEEAMMDRLERIVPQNVLAHYFYSKVLRGGVSTSSLKEALESVRRGFPVPRTDAGTEVKHPNKEAFPFLFRTGDECVVLVSPSTDNEHDRDKKLA
jgi:hypothetical protein